MTEDLITKRARTAERFFGDGRQVVTRALMLECELSWLALNCVHPVDPSIRSIHDGAFFAGAVKALCPKQRTLDRGKVVQEYAKTAPPAITGKGGHELTFRTVHHCLNSGLTEDQTFALLAEHWNPRCQPPWTDYDLREQISIVARYGQLAQYRQEGTHQ